MTCFFRACIPASTSISNCVKHLVDCTGSQPTYRTRTRLEWHTSHGTHTHTIPTKRYPNGAPLLLTATGSLSRPTATHAQLISKHMLFTLSIGKLLSEQSTTLSRAALHGQVGLHSSMSRLWHAACSPRAALRPSQPRGHQLADAPHEVWPHGGRGRLRTLSWAAAREPC